MSLRNQFLFAGLLSLASLPAFAHVTLSELRAAPGSDYVAHFRVGHGCGGSPTTALTIAFPVTQTCEKGQEVWSELPADDGHHLDHPVPLLNIGATPADAMPGMPGMGAAAANKPSPLSLSDGWIRLLPGALPAAGYFTLKNSGRARIALTGADTPACGMLMLHKSEDTGGMSSMQDVAQVAVPGGGTVRFAPGGYHLMCMDPKPGLKLGASVPVTLSFQGAPPLTARFDVRGATGK